MKDYVIRATINAIDAQKPSYRVWIDGELMCERTFWPDPKIYSICETMHVCLQPQAHTYRFELIYTTHGKAWTENITVFDEKSNEKILQHTMQPMDNNYQEYVFTINSEEIINEI